MRRTAVTNDKVQEGINNAFARRSMSTGTMPKVPAIVPAVDKPWRTV
jgi:hypothetical protein